ncbi:hypothetical protein MTO96_003290 [Rhipicephalus appendiculatus]
MDEWRSMARRSAGPFPLATTGQALGNGAGDARPELGAVEVRDTGDAGFDISSNLTAHVVVAPSTTTTGVGVQSWSDNNTTTPPPTGGHTQPSRTKTFLSHNKRSYEGGCSRRHDFRASSGRACVGGAQRRRRRCHEQTLSALGNHGDTLGPLASLKKKRATSRGRPPPQLKQLERRRPPPPRDASAKSELARPRRRIVRRRRTSGPTFRVQVAQAVERLRSSDAFKARQV